MILKGSQRGSGQNLAAHLMKLEDNEHMELHEVRGFASDNLKDAFKEIEAISRGTKCKQYLFSLSLNPPERASVTVAGFESAIERVEKQLGLEGQPRAIVFHEKEGRRHAHCVWSRIDAETMTARPLPFFKNNLMALARDLYLEHGWKMPRGLEIGGGRSPTNFTLAEWQQAKRAGVDPRWIKQVVQECWTSSDSRKSFESALLDRGFFLAKGDKRSFVVLDHQGEVYSLPRTLDLKTKEVRDRLGDGNDLDSVADTKKLIGERMTATIRRHVGESRKQFEIRSGKLGKYKEEMTDLQRSSRASLDERHVQERDDAARVRAARLPKGLQGLWQRVTGKYQKTRAAGEAEAAEMHRRQTGERDDLVQHQRDQRDVLQKQFKDLRQNQANLLLDLRKDVGRYLRLTGDSAKATGHDLGSGLGLKLTRNN